MKIILGGVCKGKRSSGVVGKIPVFGLLKRGSKVYTKVVRYKNRKAFANHSSENQPWQL
jgi:exosome complex RNA-binding protein Csl4